jgi:hypothetical protein
MIRSFLILPAICLSILTYAQQPSKSAITQSGKYYYGTGVSTDENRAREEAIREICEMIAVNVSSTFELNATEENFNYQEKATSVVRTYATGALRDTESIRTVQPDGKIEIFCYILKSEVNEIFGERIRFVRSLKQNADNNRESGNLSMALKNYYFGLILLKSIPAERLGSENNELLIEIPQAIADILQQVKFELVSNRLVSEKERHIEFSVTYYGKPVSSLHFRFWDGKQLTAVSQVRDGRANIILFGSGTELQNLKIDIQYEYYNARREYAAVEDLWDLVSRPEFSVQKNISLGKENKNQPSVYKAGKINLNHKDNIDVEDMIAQNTEAFISLLKTGTEEDILSNYGNDEFLKNKISSYKKFNRPLPYEGDITANINATRSGFEVRKIPVVHDYVSLHKQSGEYLVLDFDERGWLVDFNLCITGDLYDKFVTQANFGNDWDNRQEIIKFVEKYRTAFFTRDIQTIDLMFADEALILIGRKIQPKKQNPNEIAYTPLPGQPGFEQIQLTKQEYLTRQKQVFDYQKDILIDFSTFEIVKKNNAPGVYGVEMRQNYSSTTYADEGYLFLMIDFMVQDPLIYIRAWQPNEWDTNALINTSNFRIYK